MTLKIVPLASIKGFSEILVKSEESLEVDDKEMLQMIHDISNQMLDMVNDLLDISLIESGQLSLNTQVANLNHH
jgi:K+-sensing histidine kinase KdpD